MKTYLYMHFHNDKVLGRWVRANSAYTDQAVGAVLLSQEPTVIVHFLFQNLVFSARSPCGHRAATMRCHYGDRAMLLQHVYRLRSYKFLYNSEYTKLMPVKPYHIVRPPYGDGTEMGI